MSRDSGLIGQIKSAEKRKKLERLNQIKGKIDSLTESTNIDDVKVLAEAVSELVAEKILEEGQQG